MYIFSGYDPDCDEPADIVILLDSSGSIRFMDENNWDRIKEALKSFVDSRVISDTGSRLALVLFGYVIQVLQGKLLVSISLFFRYSRNIMHG